MHTCAVAWLAVWALLADPVAAAPTAPPTPKPTAPSSPPPPAAEALVSESTILFVEVASVPELVQRFDRTQFGQILHAPGLQAMLDTAQVNWRGMPLGVPWKTFLTHAQGRLWFAIDWPKVRERPRMVAAFDAGAHREAIDRELQLLETRLLKAPKVLRSRQGFGASTTIVCFYWPWHVDRDRHDKFMYAWCGDWLLVGDDEGLVEDTLRRWLGITPPTVAGVGRNLSPALAAWPAYRGVEAQCLEQSRDLARRNRGLAAQLQTPTVRWYARPLHVSFAWDDVTTRTGLTQHGSKELEGYQQVGFDSLEAVAGRHYLAADPHVDALSLISARAPRLYNAARLLAAIQNVQPAPPPAWVPPGAWATTFEMDLPQAIAVGVDLLSTLEETPLDDLQSGLLELLRTAKGKEAPAWFSQLGRRMTYVDIPARELGVRPAQVYALEIRSRAAVQQLLTYCFGRSKATYGKIADVHLFPPLRPLRVTPQVELIIPPEIKAIAVTDRYVFYATRLRELELVLSRLQRKAQAEQARETSVAAQTLTRLTPRQPAAAVTLNVLAPSFRAPYELFRQGGLAYDQTWVGRALADGILQELPLSSAWKTLPKFEDIADGRLGQAGWKLTRTKDGWNITGVVLSNTPPPPSVAPELPATSAKSGNRCCCCCRARPRFWRFARLCCR